MEPQPIADQNAVLEECERRRGGGREGEREVNGFFVRVDLVEREQEREKVRERKLERGRELKSEKRETEESKKKIHL